MLDVTRLKSYDCQMKEQKVSRIAFVSGRIHPPDDINNARGRRKAGVSDSSGIFYQPLNALKVILTACLIALHIALFA